MALTEGHCPNGEASVSLKFGAFIPKTIGTAVIGNPLPAVSWFVAPGPENMIPGSLKTMAATDNRSTAGAVGTNRVKTTTLVPINADEIGHLNTARRYTSTVSDDSHQILATERSWGYTYLPRSLDTRRAQPTSQETIVNVSTTESHITVSAAGHYPFQDVFSPFSPPDINYTITWKLRKTCDSSDIEISTVGSHNEFPAYESLANGSVIYGQLPWWSGPGLGNLGVFWDNFETPWQAVP